MHYVYILRCKDHTLYTGYTPDIEKRIAKHNEGKGAKYTKSRGPVTLVYSEVFATIGEALKRERAIKKKKKAEKEALCMKTNKKKSAPKKSSTTLSNTRVKSASTERKKVHASKTFFQINVLPSPASS